jgi:ABC-type branched-subunit amino acid transport system ATPase component
MTVLWAIGDMLYDSTNKRLFILYGPGGVGKSTVVNIIGAVVGGTIPTLGSQFITVSPKSYNRCVLHKSQVTAEASSRLMKIPDVDVRRGDLVSNLCTA